MAKSGVVPSSSGWSTLISGAGNVYTKLNWSSVYHPEGNYSTITVSPYYHSEYNVGSDVRFYDGGLYGNGSSLYSCSSSYSSGNRLICGGSTSWASLYPNSGSISTFNVNHNSSGVASFTVGMRGKICVLTNKTSSAFGDAAVSVSITESAPYTISYNANGGSGAPSSQSVYAGVAYTISSVQPTRDGCNFLGWATSASASTATYVGGDTVTPNGNLALYAVWSFNVSYDANGGSDAPATQVKTYGTTLTLTADVPTRAGYVFKGWASTSDAVTPQYQPGGSYTANAPVVLYAVWQLDTFTLSIAKSADGIVLNVNRIDSPYGGGQSGLLSSGATLYYGDKISVAYSLNSGYTIDTATINGVDMSGTSETIDSVTSDVAVMILTELLALAYVDNGVTVEAYQIYIDNGVTHDLYQAYIDNGSSWEAY